MLSPEPTRIRRSVWPIVMAFLLGVACVVAFLALGPLGSRNPINPLSPVPTDAIAIPPSQPPSQPKGPLPTGIVTPAPLSAALPGPTEEPSTAEPEATAKPPRISHPSKADRLRPGKKVEISSGSTFGRLTINTRPRVQVYAGSQLTLRSVKLNRSGTFTIGRGTDKQVDPFVVEVRYDVTDDGVRYALKSEPWAIVQNERSMVYGRTPVRVDAKANLTIDLVNPKEDRRLRVELRRQP